MLLIPGKLYKFKYYSAAYHEKENTIYTGIFIEQKETWYNIPFCIFECLDDETKISIPSSHLRFIMHTDPIFAKQFARGLCDYIPEDCAGIIERMILGDKVVGQGPDRYPERVCDMNGVYHA